MTGVQTCALPICIILFVNKEKVMKRKPIAAPRRMFLVAAKFKSGAGVHRKSNKALRRLEKSRGYNLMVK